MPQKSNSSYCRASKSIAYWCNARLALWDHVDLMAI